MLVIYVIQHKQMRRMLANLIFDYSKLCASRSKLVKFLMMASDDLWHILYSTHHSALQKIWMEMNGCLHGLFHFCTIAKLTK